MAPASVGWREMGRRTAITFTCSHCGSPLPLSKPGVVKCPRCGTDNFVSLPSAEPPIRPGAGEAPAPAPQLTPHVPAAIAVHAPAPRGGCGVIGAIIGLLAVAGAAAGVYFFIQHGRSAESIGSWTGSQQRICLADANGDGTMEVLGTGTIGSDQSLVAIDAATGKIVWKAPVSSADVTSTLLCGGGGVLSVDPTGNSITSIDPTTGKAGWRKDLSDKLESFAFGEKCIALTTIDKATATFDVTYGSAVACDKRDPTHALYERQEGALAGDTRVGLATSAGPGTPRLVVQATSKDGKVLWETPFSELKRDDARMIATPEGIVVAATTRTSDEELAIQILDAKTGAGLRTRIVKVKDGGSFMKLAHNGKTLFVETFGMLHTFALGTLEPGWWVGKFWVDK